MPNRVSWTLGIMAALALVAGPPLSLVELLRRTPTDGGLALFLSALWAPLAMLALADPARKSRDPVWYAVAFVALGAFSLRLLSSSLAPTLPWELAFDASILGFPLAAWAMSRRLAEPPSGAVWALFAVYHAVMFARTVVAFEAPARIRSLTDSAASFVAIDLLLAAALFLVTREAKGLARGVRLVGAGIVLAGLATLLATSVVVGQAPLTRQEAIAMTMAGVVGAVGVIALATSGGIAIDEPASPTSAPAPPAPGRAR